MKKQPRMLDLVNDAFKCFAREPRSCMNELGSHGDTHAEHGEDNNSENNSREDIKAKKLRDDATQPLYPSCGVEETKLSVIVELVGLKSTHNWSNNSFDELLKTLKRVLPSGGSGSHKRARKNFLDDDNGCSSEQLSGKRARKYHSYEQNHPSKKRGTKGEISWESDGFYSLAEEQHNGIRTKRTVGVDLDKPRVGVDLDKLRVGVDLDKLMERMDPVCGWWCIHGQSELQIFEPRQKIFVLFDEDGRPVGDKAAEYSSHLGEYSRAHASIAHHRWKNEEYNLSGTTKEKVMAKANEYWRKYKSSSLRKVYDKYRTDEERKRHCPGAVRKEDWEKFVDNESIEAAKSRRVNGKLSRQAAIARQRSGRKGSARIAHELESIKEIVASNPASTMLDLDHDPVAQVLGRDTKGRFRGLGAGVSRRGLDASAPAKNQLKMQKEMTSTLMGRSRI
ncbi:hypothetical protein IFM89_027740 [Coptis chinensis]|uniref:Transposase, Ptta/En/Spm, plant n=1 Tax=Coptis chinensis TaxID=261450 RepID=A0A835HXU6_9MAGN|nr:hypothetical protein IFM89_027740 [Coptis chinensis]